MEQAVRLASPDYDRESVEIGGPLGTEVMSGDFNFEDGFPLPPND